jgi:hypothetical protein
MAEAPIDLAWPEAERATDEEQTEYRTFPRRDVELKETRLLEMPDDYAVEVIFRVQHVPDATYGFRWEHICREATDDLIAAEDLGYETTDVLNSSVTVMLANLEELIHAAGARLPPASGTDDVVWI